MSKQFTCRLALREVRLWLKTLSVPRLVGYMAGQAAAAAAAMQLIDWLRVPTALQVPLAFPLMLGWTVTLSPWATKPVRQAWEPPPVGPDDMLIEASIVRAGRTEHTILILHPDGVYEEFSGPVAFGPDDYLTVP